MRVGFTREAATVSLAGARALTDSALSIARDRGLSVAVAVTDGGGHLVAFARDDGASAFGCEAASAKARAAAASGMATARWAELAAGQPGLQTLPGAVIVAGGQPLPFASGGIGIAGSSPADDDAVAVAALAGWTA